MKRFIFLLLSLFTLLALKALSQPPVPFDLIGYATMNGGTTGGQGGTTVTVTTLAEFKLYAQTANTPYVILVSGHLTSGNDKGASVSVQSNKTIIGLGSDAFLDGIGLNISSKRNIIIRNLKFTMISITNTTDPSVYDIDGDEGRPQILTNSGDCIKIQNSSENIWVDHCEFYAKDPAVQTNQDLYDGLIDVTGPSKYITISWCYFHEHHKCTLVGSSDSDNNDRMITFHHNYYYKISQRTPSYRYGKAHIFNNYYLSVKSSGINSRMGACLGIEKNLFESSNSSITYSTGGQYDLTGNSYVTCTGAQPTVSSCNFEAPYSYSTVFQETADIKATVQQYAGVGILTDQNFQTDYIGITSPVNNTNYSGSANLTITADANAGSGSVTKVEFYNGSTLLGEDDTAPYGYDWNNVAPGTYNISAKVIDNTGQSAISAPRTVIVNSPTGLFGPSQVNILTEVYPNPSEGSFTVNVKEKVKHLSIYNMYGGEVDSRDDFTSGQEVGASLERGSYVLRIEYFSNKIEMAKLIKL